MFICPTCDRVLTDEGICPLCEGAESERQEVMRDEKLDEESHE